MGQVAAFARLRSKPGAFYRDVDVAAIMVALVTVPVDDVGEPVVIAFSTAEMDTDSPLGTHFLGRALGGASSDLTCGSITMEAKAPLR